MRILVVVPRYGRAIVGGIETAARTIAEQMAGRGHTVEVITSCAVDASTWADAVEPGTSHDGGVTIHRLASTYRRDPATFDPLDAQVLSPRRPLPLAVQYEWLDALGPQLPGLAAWLRDAAPRFDVAFVMPYLYPTTRTALAVLHERLPVVLFPATHDEPAFHLTMYDTLLRLPDAMAFFTPEESDLMTRRLRHPVAVSAVTGLGLSFDWPAASSVPEGGGASPAPYLICLGRINPPKGVPELVRCFCEYRRRRPTTSLELVLGGDEWRDEVTYPGVRTVGFLSEADKFRLLRGAVALVQPSYLESFSIVLCEGWLAGLPALVQGANPVLVGQVRRSGGGQAYSSYGEFEAAVDQLMARPEVARAVGEAGQRYVLANYSWEVVGERIEALARAGRQAYQARIPGDDDRAQ
jgi:glycosyltransferase involved in cell wall biosynthesis